MLKPKERWSQEHKIKLYIDKQQYTNEKDKQPKT